MAATATAVNALPQTYELGTPTAEFSTAPKRNIRFFLGFLILVVGETGAFLSLSPYLYLYPRDMFTAIGGIGVLVAIVGYIVIEASLRYRQLRILIFPDGFIQTRAGKTDTIRWHEVNSIWQSVTRRYVNGVYTGTTYKYTLLTAGGQKFMFGNGIKNIEQFGNLLQQYVITLRLPEAIAAYNGGQVVNFGPLSVSQMGLTKGNQTVPWSEIQGVQVQRGYIKVKKQTGWFNFANVRVSAVPNVFVLLSLVDRIVGIKSTKKG